MALARHVQRAGAKAEDVQVQIAVLQRAAAVHPQAGGVTFGDVDDQITFQQWRLGIAQWAAKTGKAKVAARLAELLAGLTPEERACVGGDARTMSEAAYLAVCEIELLMIALGTHPGSGEG